MRFRVTLKKYLNFLSVHFKKHKTGFEKYQIVFKGRDMNILWLCKPREGAVEKRRRFHEIFMSHFSSNLWTNCEKKTVVNYEPKSAPLHNCVK